MIGLVKPGVVAHIIMWTVILAGLLIVGSILTAFLFAFLLFHL